MELSSNEVGGGSRVVGLGSASLALPLVGAGVKFPNLGDFSESVTVHFRARRMP